MYFLKGLSSPPTNVWSEIQLLEEFLFQRWNDQDNHRESHYMQNIKLQCIKIPEENMTEER